MPIVAACLALVLACLVRYLARLVEDHNLRPLDHSSEPIVVFGAGNAGAQIVKMMMHSPDSPYRPVALLDDDPRKSHLRIHGLRGPRHAGGHLRGGRRATAPSPCWSPSRRPAATVLREFATPLVGADLSVLVLPPVGELLGDAVGVATSARSPMPTCSVATRSTSTWQPIAGYLTGRRVLVTGAGGSIGSELCRQIARVRARRRW